MSSAIYWTLLWYWNAMQSDVSSNMHFPSPLHCKALFSQFSRVYNWRANGHHFWRSLSKAIAIAEHWRCGDVLSWNVGHWTTCSACERNVNTNYQCSQCSAILHHNIARLQCQTCERLTLDSTHTDRCGHSIARIATNVCDGCALYNWCDVPSEVFCMRSVQRWVHDCHNGQHFYHIIHIY